MTKGRSNRARDDFSKLTINTLARRVAFRCSNPECRQPTVGPQQGSDGFVVVGIAAHITAAAPGGPRYDISLSPEQRRHQDNGIWLCQIHGKQIDADEEHFTVDLLKAWKQKAEQSAAVALTSLEPGRDVGSIEDFRDAGGFGGNTGASGQEASESTRQRILEAAIRDIAAFRGASRQPRQTVLLDLALIDNEAARPFDVERLATLVDIYNEIAVVASPGRGKTTTALHLVHSLLAGKGMPTVYIPLSEWATRGGSFVESLTQRGAFRNVPVEDFIALAASGKLALVLDGWNELDESARKRATVELRGLRRDFPDIRLVVCSRQRALDVPLTGPVVRIEDLTDLKQLELARALRGSDGEKMLDHARRTAGLRELVSIPLYLTALMSWTGAGDLPTTKEEVLRLFVDEHEKREINADTLRERLFGSHRDLLIELAVVATSAEATTLAEAEARTALKKAADKLVAAGQLAAAFQPAPALDALVDFHLLVRLGGGLGAIGFQHQQFQEWYASYEVEGLILGLVQGDAAARRRLRERVLDVRAWEEAVLFACERVSRRDAQGASAVATAILDALEVDPRLAAEMIFRAGGTVWEEIEPSVVAFVEQWHEPGAVDRAVDFMVGCGRDRFALELWRLITDSDDQIQLAALRAGHRFRLSALGNDARARITGLPEDLRATVLSEIAMRGGLDGMELAADVASEEQGPSVRTAVIEALLFRGAGRLVDRVLQGSPDDVWRELARKGYADEVANPDAVARLREEQARLVENEQDPLQQLSMLRRGGSLRGDDAARAMAFVASPDFPLSDNQASWFVSEAFERFPDQISSALIERLQAGLDVPFGSSQMLRAKSHALNEGRVTETVFRQSEHDAAASAAAAVVGPATISRLLDRISEVVEGAEAKGGWSNDERAEYHALRTRVCGTNIEAFVEALMQGSENLRPEAIGLAADLFASHGNAEFDEPAAIGGLGREPMTALIGRWSEALLASSEATRGQMADVARSIARVPEPSLFPMLQRLLAEDLARWKQARKAFLMTLQRGGPTRDDARMSYKLQYQRALIAIGGADVYELMLTYLADAGYCGFGQSAAGVIKDLSDRGRGLQPLKAVPMRSPFADVRARRAERSRGARPTCREAEAIFAVVGELIAPDAGQEKHMHALALACTALQMPHGDKTGIVSALLELPVSWAAKLPLLKVMAVSGEVVDAGMILAALDETLEEAKTNRWLLDEQSGAIGDRLALLPFSSRPAAFMEALDRLAPELPTRGRLQRAVSAVGYAPSPASEQILFDLARRDPQMRSDYAWLNALEACEGVEAARKLLEFVVNSVEVEGSLSREPFVGILARGARSHPEFRSDLYAQYAALPPGRNKRILEAAIAKAPDTAAILLMTTTGGAERKAFNETALGEALRNHLTTHRSSSHFSGAQEIVSVPAPDLRKQLFTLAAEDNDISQLAIASLKEIDDLREHFGTVHSEPRHPDISSGRPWPIMRDWRRR